MSIPPVTDTYTPLQIEAYLSDIGFPTTKYPQISPATARSPEGLPYLTQLQKYHLAAVPFENLSLHYSPHHTVSLDKDDLFEKIVGFQKDREFFRGGRGGYCMENNLFFGAILRSFGYDVVPIAARVFPPGGVVLGLNHQFNLVFLTPTEPYLVDVGFGGNGPVSPLPLVADNVTPWGSTTSETRLTFSPNSRPCLQGTWRLDFRTNPKDEWVPQYSFATVEFTAADFVGMNFSTYTRRQSWFTHRIVAVKVLLDPETDEVIGSLILDGAKFKRRVRGKDELLAECRTEKERVEGLEKWFKIYLSTAEKRGIDGMVSMLK